MDMISFCCQLFKTLKTCTFLQLSGIGVILRDKVSAYTNTHSYSSISMWIIPNLGVKPIQMHWQLLFAVIGDEQQHNTTQWTNKKDENKTEEEK